MTELIELARQKDFDGVLAGFRQCARDEVLATAEWLREDDIYHVAIELYRWLLDYDESALLHFGIGQCYGKIYDFDTALHHLDIAFTLDPDRGEGASYYAYVLERQGRMADADKWYRAALAGAEADDLWARSHYAWFLEKWGRTDKACLTYDEVLVRNPLYTWAVKRYALLLHALGHSDRALALLRGALDLAPDNRFAVLNCLEFLLLTENDDYVTLRGALAADEGPAWYPVMLEMYDYYRDHLLPGTSDEARLTEWQRDADALTDSVHRDFEDLTMLLAQRGGDLDTWRDQIKRLLK